MSTKAGEMKMNKGKRCWMEKLLRKHKEIGGTTTTERVREVK